MKNRVEIEEAENGYTMRIWKTEEMKDEYGYCEPEIYIAKTLNEALKVVKDNFTVKEEGEE